MSGVWQEVVVDLYNIFREDFVRNHPAFEGRDVWYDRRVLPGERHEEGFWHLISRHDRATGDRLPDFRRAERLAWCAATIRNSQDVAVKVWNYQESSGRVRTYLWLEELDYVVILEKRKHRRGEIAFLVTAFHLDGESGRRMMERKYRQRCRQTQSPP